VLLVEDNPTDALIVKDELAHSENALFSVVHTEQLEQALGRLGEQRFDVALLDLSLPDSHGFQTFLRFHDEAPEIPVVVLSGRAEEDLALRAVHAGAQDYLVKGRLGEDVLSRAIRYAIERQRAERTLAESQERYRLLIERSPNAYLVICDGEIVFANAASMKMFGAGQLEELLGRAITDIVPSEFHETVRKRTLKAHANGNNAPIEIMGLRLDGTTVAVEGNGNSFIHDGKPAMQVVLHDLTERKRVEEHIREQASMLDQAHDAITVRDIHTQRVTFWNQGAERLFGWTRAEAMGREMGELTHPDPHVQEIVTGELLKTGEWRGEYSKTTKDGKKLTISGHVTLLLDSRGDPKAALAIDIDITEQKDLEARFLRAQRMECMGTLASGVAHDLNNILAPIMMSVPLLRYKLTAQQLEEIIATIEISAERGAQIVKQVLTFGRGLQGEKCALKAGLVIDEVMKIMRGTFPKNLAIESSPDPHLWPVMGDVTQLHQVLLNLCVNARDAMPDGGTLRLQATNVELNASNTRMLSEATPGAHILLEVSDTGSGIPPEIVERIFDPFFTTKGVGKGTGLGLSTVIGIVKNHGGFVHVTSQPGKGSTFQVYLPAAEDGKVVEPVDAAPAGPPAGNGELVLVVDDEVAITDAARVILELHGYRVMLAADGIEALALFMREAGRIGVVLTDLMMPAMDGLMLIRTLHEMKPELPVIASTGLGEKQQSAELKALGVRTMLNKPYGSDMLLRTVHGVLHAGAKPQSTNNEKQHADSIGANSELPMEATELTGG
jgi:hypothetical protein